VLAAAAVLIWRLRRISTAAPVLATAYPGQYGFFPTATRDPEEPYPIVYPTTAIQPTDTWTFFPVHL
jgi:hypothetical protein